MLRRNVPPMADITISPTSAQISDHRDALDALSRELMEMGLTVDVDPRSSARGPVLDILIYLGEQARDMAIDAVLLEAGRRMLRSFKKPGQSPPQRFVLVDEDGETIREVPITDGAGSGV